MSRTSTVTLPGEQKLTLEEWADLPEDEPGEFVDGVLVEEEMADLVHEAVVAWLMRVLGPWLRARRGWVLGSEVKLGVAPRRGRKADLIAWLPGHPPLPPRGVVRIPPDVAIEVVSPRPADARRDRLDKAVAYAAFGVRWYCLVAPQVRSVEIFELGADGRYVRSLGVSSGTVTSVPGCEGLTLELDALWAEVDEIASPAAPDADS